MKYLIKVILALLASMLLQGCIPPNENIGKPPPHSYKDGYYDGYYGDGYYHHAPYYY